MQTSNMEVPRKKNLYNLKGDDRDACETYSCVPTVATTMRPATTSKGRMFIVDSGASLHMMGISSPARKHNNTVRPPQRILEIHTANDSRHRSRCKSLHQRNRKNSVVQIGGRFSIRVVIEHVMQCNGIYPLVTTWRISSLEEKTESYCLQHLFGCNHQAKVFADSRDVLW